MSGLKWFRFASWVLTVKHLSNWLIRRGLTVMNFFYFSFSYLDDRWDRQKKLNNYKNARLEEFNRFLVGDTITRCHNSLTLPFLVRTDFWINIISSEFDNLNTMIYSFQHVSLTIDCQYHPSLSLLFVDVSQSIVHILLIRSL